MSTCLFSWLAVVTNNGFQIVWAINCLMLRTTVDYFPSPCFARAWKIGPFTLADPAHDQLQGYREARRAPPAGRINPTIPVRSFDDLKTLRQSAEYQLCSENLFSF
jgi:hypothetical protein